MLGHHRLRRSPTLTWWWWVFFLQELIEEWLTRRGFEQDANTAASALLGAKQGRCPFSGLSSPGLPAAVLVEPVQGRGGDRTPPKGWLRALRQLCDQHGMLLIFDEVYTGFGRAGALFQVPNSDAFVWERDSSHMLTCPVFLHILPG